MAANRPGQDSIRFFLPDDLKKDFELLCFLEHTTMTAKLVEYVEEVVTANSEKISQLRKVRGEDE